MDLPGNAFRNRSWPASQSCILEGEAFQQVGYHSQHGQGLMAIIRAPGVEDQRSQDTFGSDGKSSVRLEQAETCARPYNVCCIA